MNEKNEAAAFASALRMLSRRDHSEQELCRKLCGKGYPAEAVAGTIDKLRDLNYLDDRRFAERWVENALTGQRFFGARLKMELLRRGVSPDLAAEAVAAATGSRDEPAMLAEILERKFPGFDAAGAPVSDQRRVYNYLLRKGFSPSAVLQALRHGET